MTASFISTNEIRLRFTQAMSKMYQHEVPLYKKWLSIAGTTNQKVINNGLHVTANDEHLLALEHHGAIRVGTAEELSVIRRLFAVMGMQAVDYYDLSIAGIPVHSTAFRALDKDDLAVSPFRVFCSLLRLELIDNVEGLKDQAKNILKQRNIFPDELLKLIELSEKQEGLTQEQSISFIDNALDVFRWHKKATVNKPIYDKLKNTHGLVADVVSFKGPHINHLTPKILDIDACSRQFTKNQIKAKAFIEGPPKRNCPILLRQTSFLAIEENVIFADGESGYHTARFGEVEQRGIALTPKGRGLYDQLLNKAKNNDKDSDYLIRLTNAFKDFPDSYEEMRKQGLAYFNYSVSSTKKDIKIQQDDIEALIEKRIIEITPINYEDFLPVSAAGIFTSNLVNERENSNLQISKESDLTITQNSSLDVFQEALGTSVINSFEVYEKQQKESLIKSLETLGVKPTNSI